MYTKTCKGCNNTFDTANYRKLRCRPNCNRADARNPTRTEKRSTNDIEFIGVDGEGVDRPDGRHEYVMLSVGDKTLFDEGRPLTLHAIFKFLWAAYTDNPEASFVGFFLGYDFNLWFRMLPEDIARLMLTTTGTVLRTSSVRGSRGQRNPYPDAVVWEGWEIDILAGRRFRLRPHVHNISKYNGSCRNRTCDHTLAIFPGRVDNEPCCVPVGESTFRIPEAEESDCNPRDVGEFGEAFWTQFPVCDHVLERRSERKQHGWMYLCDTGPFWQTSFLNVINPSGWDGVTPPCTKAEYALIAKGKEGRGIVVADGDTSYAEEMMRYNTLENSILARVTERLNLGFMSDEHIKIKIPKADWYGPGRAAQLWIDQLSARLTDPVAVEHNKSLAPGEKRRNEGSLRNADVYMSMPEWAYEAARKTYYGGWFEQMAHGHIGDVWEYDINSAYPHIISQLPCLHPVGVGNHNGEWTRGEGKPERRLNGIYMVYGDFHGRNRFIGAMPYRTHTGVIIRPSNVKGWYFLDEVEAAERADLLHEWECEEYVEFIPCECGKPFDPPDIGISRMYDLRLEVGKNTPQGKGFKLVYNSAYGKSAQSLGSPKYANPFYASLITSGCRTMILDAIATHPGGACTVTMVATDGVYFTSPHPTLDLSPTQLGKWDVTEKKSLTQFMPGVYWDNAARGAIAAGGTPQFKSRGVSARDLAKQIATIDKLFAYFPETMKWPTITMTVGFALTTAKSALNMNRWDKAGKVEHNTQRTIDSDPHNKRMGDPFIFEQGEEYVKSHIRAGILRTEPHYGGAPPGDPRYETHYYDRTFGYREYAETERLFEDMVNRDGRQPQTDWTDLLF